MSRPYGTCPAARPATLPGAMDLAEARAFWEADRPYLNTASFGLPPKPAWDEFQAALEDWRHGRVSWEPWGEATDRARSSFARLLHTEPEHVAHGASVSQLVSLVAASLPQGARIVLPEIDFTSLIFPFLALPGAEVEAVPLDRLVDAIDSRTTLVAVSAVQSSTGEVADLDAIGTAARTHGALVLVDATQAAGWLPLRASQADFMVVAAYKWLLSPRGSAFLTVRPGLLDTIPPLAANWWAGEDIHASYYGPPLRLAKEARRLDISPAWFSWIGTAPALELFEEIGVEQIQGHNVALANRFREGLGLEPSDSAIVSASVPGAEEKLRAAGIMAAVRQGDLRASFHVYNTEADVDAALDALS
jgi:selenocysteine lyase/cysteine desulfurase